MDTTMTEPGQTTRPKFLQVMCILSFVGIGFVYLFSAIGINKTFLQSEQDKASERDMTVQKVIQMNPEADEGAILEALSEGEKYEKPNWFIGVACNILTLIGVIMMWQMKKTGFYLYTAGELVSYLLTILFCGMDGMKAGIHAASIWGSFAENMAIAVFTIVVVFDIVFIVLYAMNLKHMK